MNNLWIVFKCLSLVAGCLLMISIIVAIVETIREKFIDLELKKQINQITIENFKKELNKNKKDKK